MKFIEGGVCAAQGFTASGIHCGIRKNRDKRDLALIVSQKRAAAAAVYTQNLVKGAPLLVTKANIADGYASAILCNSGNANTCNADGEEVAQKMCALAAQRAGHPRRGRGGRLHRRHRPEAGHLPHRRGHGGARFRPFRGRFARRRSHPHHGHEGQVRRRGVFPRRQDRASGRHRQGLGHDPPQHGHHAGVCDHGRGHCPADAAKGALGGRSDELQPHQRRRRHLHQRHVLRAGQRHGRERRDHRRGRRLRGLLRGAERRHHRPVPHDRPRRRGRDQVGRMRAHRRQDAGGGGRRFQGGDLLVAGQGGDVRLRRQLGPRTLRHRLRGRGRGCRQSGRVFPLRRRARFCVQKRRGRGLFRGRGQEGAARGRSDHRSGPQRRKRFPPSPGAATSPTTM